MRAVKFLFVCNFIALFLMSCSEQEDSVVFYSQDTITNTLVLKHTGTSQAPVTILEDSSDMTLTNSPIFSDNTSYLEELEVTKFSYKIKELQGDAMCLAKVQIFIGSTPVTDFINLKSFDSKNINTSYSIDDDQVISQILSSLKNNENVTFLCREHNSDNKPMHVEIEFNTEIKGTFVD
ncbi:hypothetical protein GCM10011416_04130 [Polaribacter pacificus]|uniref:Lipoprotein n=1 Tax=Polaribacter pacificus TaxID=1775173 RepID=A0A917MBW4_9FLAO|nr:hypothetical protein [Polaribacter pacificus]GGG90808.1 hypothetical protein GCM10011416_04130 [Polaribacter pacificus]